MKIAEKLGKQIELQIARDEHNCWTEQDKTFTVKVDGIKSEETN